MEGHQQKRGEEGEVGGWGRGVKMAVGPFGTERFWPMDLLILLFFFPEIQDVKPLQSEHPETRRGHGAPSVVQPPSFFWWAAPLVVVTSASVEICTIKPPQYGAAVAFATIHPFGGDDVGHVRWHRGVCILCCGRVWETE